VAEQYEFVTEKHPLYEAHAAEWQRNEILHEGSAEVFDELARFDWEEMRPVTGEKAADEKAAHEAAIRSGRSSAPSGNRRYEQRKRQATYLNFPEMLTHSMVGHLMTEAPVADVALDFGELGTVRREDDDDDASFAEIVYYNVDGVGNDGSQWDNWWSGVSRRALATGHRWLMVQGPAEMPEVVTFADVKRGIRPYLIELSPLAVTNWHYEHGVLQFAVIQSSVRRPRVVDGKYETGEQTIYTLLVRAGYADLGADFAGGGWWKFNESADLIQMEGEPEHDTFEMFGGAIPMWPHYGERSSGTFSRPAMSRSATIQLGQAAVAYMNLESAAEFDAWDAGLSMLFFLGVTPENFNAAAEQLYAGSRWIGVKMTEPVRSALDPAAGASPTMPVIFDGSTGAVEAGVFETVLARIRENAGKLAAQEASGTPDSSGRSKQAGFEDIKAPRLALLASEVEQSQNIAIHFFENAFGFESPFGEVRWRREFDLLSLTDQIKELFDMQEVVKVRSTRLDAEALVKAMTERGLLTSDEEASSVRDELVAASRLRRVQELADAGVPMPGTAQAVVVLDVLEAMGLFEDPENPDQERLIELAEGELPLRDAVKEAILALADAADRRTLQGSQFGLLLPPNEETPENGGPPRPGGGSPAEGGTENEPPQRQPSPTTAP
jgi:hypothetical protein